MGFAPAAPTIQSNLAQGKALLHESPQSILERHEEADVPLMMGSTRHDGSFVVGVIYNQFLKFNKLANDTEFLRTEFVPKCLNALGNTILLSQQHIYVSDPEANPIHFVVVLCRSGIKDETQIKELTRQYVGEKAVNSGNLTLMLPGLIDVRSSKILLKYNLYSNLMYSKGRFCSFPASYCLLFQRTIIEDAPAPL